MTDVLWYGAVRPSVRSVHNPCGQDMARTIWPRMLKLSVYTLYEQRKKPIDFQSQISRSLGLFKEFWHLDPCGQDIARTIWPRLLKLSMYTLYGKRKKPIDFQGQRSHFKVTGPLQRILALGSLWAGYSKNYLAYDAQT